MGYTPKPYEYNNPHDGLGLYLWLLDKGVDGNIALDVCIEMDMDFRPKGGTAAVKER